MIHVRINISAGVYLSIYFVNEWNFIFLQCLWLHLWADSVRNPITLRRWLGPCHLILAVQIFIFLHVQCFFAVIRYQRRKKTPTIPLISIISDIFFISFSNRNCRFQPQHRFVPFWLLWCKIVHWKPIKKSPTNQSFLLLSNIRRKLFIERLVINFQWLESVKILST